jgi:hypothetical protein
MKIEKMLSAEQLMDELERGRASGEQQGWLSAMAVFDEPEGHIGESKPQMTKDA